MVIKNFTLLVLMLSSPMVFSKARSEIERLQETLRKDETVDPEKYSQSFKDSIWQEYQQEGSVILKENSLSGKLSDTQTRFKTNAEYLSALEYKESETEKLDEKVQQHIRDLEGRVYHKTSSVFVEWVSWQDEVTLKSPTAKTDVAITNTVYCAGGAYGYENSRFHYFVDGCFFYGWANTGSESNAVTYHQKDIPTYGVKAAPGAGIYVSPEKAEMGLKLPLLYFDQSLDKPNGPGFRFTRESNFRSFLSLYFHYPIKERFKFQMEFGKSLGQETTLWSLGVGYKF